MQAARRLYDGGRAEAEDLAVLGIPERARKSFGEAAVEFEVWPENWPALELFAAVSTQWRVGMAGATGLDYAGVLAAMEFYGVKPEERRARFEDLRIMERAALEAMAEKAARKG